MEKIAGQNQKRYTDKAAALKYLEGRKKAYAYLFSEVSPPIPQKYERHFKVYGTLLPGYSIEGREQEKADQAASQVLEGGFSASQKEEKTSVLGKLSEAKSQEKVPALPGVADRKKEDRSR